MNFSYPLDRDGTDVTVRVKASVQPYADACGVPSEYRSRFAGRLDVELLEVLDDATGLELVPELTDSEREELTSYAVDHRDDERDARESDRRHDDE